MVKTNKILTSLMLLAVCILTGCEKMPDDEAVVSSSSTSGKNVVISISGIDAGWDGNSTRSLVPISEVCSRVCFAVYQDDTRLVYKNQKAGDADFGSYSITLEAGTYQLLVLGHSGAANPTTTNPAKIAFSNPTSSNGTGFTDTFYYYGTIVVNNGTTQLNINMKRATAMFRLKTTDTKPTAVKKFHFYYTGGSGTLDATTGYGCVASKQSVLVDATESGCQQFDVYTFPHQEEDEVTFTVKAIGANDNMLYSKEFVNVKMKRNCITQYSGKFFTNSDVTPPEEPDDSDSSEPSSVIKVDPEWGQIIEKTF